MAGRAKSDPISPDWEYAPQQAANTVEKIQLK